VIRPPRRYVALSDNRATTALARLPVPRLATGIGDFLAAELSDDPVVVKQCAAAFKAVWDRAVPHGEYQLR
jgi:Family of unknown function (DUF6879)